MRHRAVCFNVGGGRILLDIQKKQTPYEEDA